jgi:hypothetical protein
MEGVGGGSGRGGAWRWKDVLDVRDVALFLDDSQFHIQLDDEHQND